MRLLIYLILEVAKTYGTVISYLELSTTADFFFTHFNCSFFASRQPERIYCYR